MNVPQAQVAWAGLLLPRIDALIVRNALIGMTAWEIAEGGWFNNDADFNPLNTTMPYRGSFPVTAVQVQSYASEDDGLTATVLTLENGDYPGILAALRAGLSPELVASAVGLSVWGTLLDGIVGAIPAATSYVDTYWTPPNEGEPMEFATNGTGTYYRLGIYTPDAGQAPNSPVEQWREVPVEVGQEAAAAGIHIFGPAALALYAIHKS